jgi:energy-coupling factor transporter ATP-binding protein EcfA2
MASFTQSLKNAVRDEFISMTKATAKDLVKTGVRAGAKKASSSISGLSSLGGGGKYLGYDWPKWVTDPLTNRAGSVVAVIGKRHSGKTNLCVVMAEYLQNQTGAPIYFPGYPKDMAPRHIETVPTAELGNLLDTIQPGAALILDDASTVFNSKRTMSSAGLEFEGWINTVAHKGVHLFLNAQDSADVNKAGLRADLLLFKPPERMFEGSERRAMRPLVARAVDEFKRLPEADWVKHAWVWIDKDKCGMLKYDRPEWMTTSRAKYRGGAFQRGENEGAPTSSRRLSGRTTNDIYGSPNATIDGVSGVDPFGGGVI